MSCDPTTTPPGVRAIIHAHRYRESPLGQAEDRLWVAVRGWYEEGSHGPDEVAEAAAEYARLKREADAPEPEPAAERQVRDTGPTHARWCHERGQCPSDADGRHRWPDADPPSRCLRCGRTAWQLDRLKSYTEAEVDAMDDPTTRAERDERS